ncbi:hypothetical protein L596_028635 [Steinernema carpocapsae]|uniref:Uncharacterized protein n=1 Tax=Steinernema carpocapsae TaxID=34508 RepID=A0A4U5LYY9_STECR|nr:hypothetical protein L596_028635 [Steinernema carpocapsae]
MMNEITRQNFATSLPKLEALLQHGSFVALDFEFLGLPQENERMRPSLLDSPEERYAKNRESVRRFPPVQLGLSIFIEREDGRTYDIYVYNIYLFKQLQGLSLDSFSYTAVAFLLQHEFDFTKWIDCGVGFANNDEIAEIEKRLTGRTCDYNLFGESLQARLDLLKKDIEVKISCDAEMFDPSTAPVIELMDFALSIELCPAVNQRRYSFSHTIWRRPQTDIERAAVLYELTYCYPNVDFQIEDCVLFLKRLTTKDSHEKRIEDALNRLINHVRGASAIIKAIIKSKLPVVMHNCSLDLLYLYQHFTADLPGCFRTAKKDIIRAFPIIMDTKLLAMANSSVLREHRVFSVDLETLKAYFERGPGKQFDLPQMNAPSMTKNVNDHHDRYHNAAFDSKTTGEIFIKLGNLFVGMSPEFADIRAKRRRHFSFREVLYLMRPFVNGRIPISFMRMPFLNFLGEDGTPFESYNLVVRKRVDPVATADQAKLLVSNNHLLWWSWLQSLVDYLNGAQGRRAAQLRVMTTMDVALMYNTVIGIGGKWKCDLKLADDQLSVDVICNCYETYTRLFHFFSHHDHFMVCKKSLNGKNVYSVYQKNEKKTNDDCKSCTSALLAVFPNFYSTLKSKMDGRLGWLRSPNISLFQGFRRFGCCYAGRLCGHSLHSLNLSHFLSFVVHTTSLLTFLLHSHSVNSPCFASNCPTFHLLHNNQSVEIVSQSKKALKMRVNSTKEVINTVLREGFVLNGRD